MMSDAEWTLVKDDISQREGDTSYWCVVIVRMLHEINETLRAIERKLPEPGL